MGDSTPRSWIGKSQRVRTSPLLAPHVNGEEIEGGRRWGGGEKSRWYGGWKVSGRGVNTLVKGAEIVFGRGLTVEEC